MRQQNYHNHRFFEPISYFILGPLSLILCAAIVTEWIEFARAEQSIWSTCSTSALLFSAIVLSIKARIYALVAQDRAIRAEEQIRHFILTGQALDGRLTTAQIVALRFAADDEFPDLAVRAVAEQWNAQQIKRAIKNWRADWHRV
jgi:hypothetical protein